MKKQIYFTTLCTLIWGFSAKAASVPLDTRMSTVKWHGKKIVGDDHWGNLKFKSGTLDFKGDELTGGTLVVDMTSLTVGDMTDMPDRQQKLTTHLKSDDFFSVEHYPTATFTIESVTPLPNSAKPMTRSVTGKLTIKGKTNKLKMDAEFMHHGPLFHAMATPIIDRTLYDVRYGSGKFFQGLADKAIKDDFDLELNVFAKIPTTEKKK